MSSTRSKLRRAGKPLRALPAAITGFMFQGDSMKSPKSVKTLENFGRVRLSKSFFMRDFLYSEISQIEGIPNIPDDPKLAILAG